ncbi:thioredoxin family protein [Aquibacillus sediminis]|uniref:thioredoxin family protein n=1 Tax=Aquibacillus sediminis TaxID=2574734 RepID=UPI001108A4C0|nr:thioredoxin family protein [Aquibacillus sediminis]
MKEIQTNEELSEKINKDEVCIFIHSPFCGTCHLARKMLHTIEVMCGKEIVHELSAPYFPQFMQTYKVTSVPCLMIAKQGKVVEMVYAFQSVPFLHGKLSDLIGGST